MEFIFILIFVAMGLIPFFIIFKVIRQLLRAFSGQPDAMDALISSVNTNKNFKKTSKNPWQNSSSTSKNEGQEKIIATLKTYQKAQPKRTEQMAHRKNHVVRSNNGASRSHHVVTMGSSGIPPSRSGNQVVSRPSRGSFLRWLIFFGVLYWLYRNF